MFNNSSYYTDISGIKKLFILELSLVFSKNIKKIFKRGGYYGNEI